MGTLRTLKYAEAVNEGLRTAMAADDSVLCYGLGVPDPRGVFGTTLGLEELFGSQRVFDMPTAENGMTGVAIGAALGGLRPVMTHQRLDFFLLAMDQLVNSAAKWHYMFGGHASVPITIRLVVGRGWGQGPTHSQSLQSWFVHVPGLKVVMPASPGDAKGLLLSSIFDPNPVIYIEHRWLHEMEGQVPLGDHRIPLGEARVVREGSDVSIIAMSHMTIEAARAADFLGARGVSCDVLDLRSLSPLDWDAVFATCRKTGRAVVVDSAPACGSVSSEIVARVAMELWEDMKVPPRRLAMPDYPTPTSYALTKGFYPEASDLVRAVSEMLSLPIGEELGAEISTAHDVPGSWFTGPF